MKTHSAPRRQTVAPQRGAWIIEAMHGGATTRSLYNRGYKIELSASQNGGLTLGQNSDAILKDSQKQNSYSCLITLLLLAQVNIHYSPSLAFLFMAQVYEMHSLYFWNFFKNIEISPFDYCCILEGNKLLKFNTNKTTPLKIKRLKINISNCQLYYYMFYLLLLVKNQT